MSAHISMEVHQKHDGSLVIVRHFHGGRIEREHVHTLQSRDYLERVESAAMAGAVWPWIPAMPGEGK